MPDLLETIIIFAKDKGETMHLSLDWLYTSFQKALDTVEITDPNWLIAMTLVRHTLEASSGFSQVIMPETTRNGISLALWAVANEVPGNPLDRYFRLLSDIAKAYRQNNA